MRLVLVAAAAVLPALALIVAEQWTVRRTAREQAVESSLRLTRLIASEQASVVDGAARLLDTLADIPAVVAPDPAECDRILPQVLRQHRGFLDVAVVRANGAVFCSAEGAPPSLRVADRSWFIKAAKSDATVSGDLLARRQHGDSVLVVARRVLRPDGTLRVLSALIGAGYLQTVLDRTPVPAHMTVTVFDRHRVIVARVPEEAAMVGRRVPDRAQTDDARTDQIEEAAGVDGVRRLYVTTRVDAGFDTGLWVGTGIAPDVIFAPIDERRNQQMLGIALVTLIALGVAAFGSRTFIVDPVQSLSRATEQIARGDLNARVALETRTPGLQELAGSINAMAVALERRDRDRAQLEDQLREAAGRYQLLFERNPHPMWVYDLTTLRFLEVNRAAVDQYGYTREEFLAMSIRDLHPPDQVDSLAHAVEDARVREQPREGVFRHRVKSGAVIDVEIASDALQIHGRPARLVLAHDISERLRVERRLHETEERLRFALHAARVGAWEANLATGEAFWSDTFEALHGLPAGGFGQTVAAFLERVHPDDRAETEAAMSTAVEQHQDLALEYRTLWPDGTERRISSTARFFYDEAGTPIRVAGVASDVTERRRLEEQLRQAHKMEAVGQLAGGIAHDFNNMLTAILGNAEFALEDLPPDHAVRPDVEEIRRAAQRAAGLTHQLLAFSRKQILAPTVLRVGDVIARVTPMLRRVIREDIALKTTIADQATVKVDATQLEQVVMNLVVNARDAMPGGGRLLIETFEATLDAGFGRTHPGAAPGEYVVLAISDSGHGMDPATERRIFEPFFTTKAKGQGTGLGLATVYGIVKQSGGYIEVSSELGRGTTFKVYLPRVTGTAAAPEEEEVARPAPRGTETVLLVEDEDVVREFTAKILSRAGYQVHAIAHPHAALRFCDEYRGRIDALITDVVLPDMRGGDVAAEVQRRQPQARVLFMSGYTDGAIADNGILDDGLAFLQKPFTGAALLARVREVLGPETDGAVPAAEAGHERT